MSRWILRIPEKYLTAQPLIRIGYAYSLIFTNQYEKAQKQINLIKNNIPPKFKAQIECSLDFMECIIHTFKDHIYQAIQLCEKWLKKWGDKETLEGKFIHAVLCANFFYSSKLKLGIRSGEQGSAESLAADLHYNHIWSEGCQGVIYMTHGQLAKAQNKYQYCIDYSDKHFGKNFSLAMLIQVLEAEIYYEQGDLSTCKKLLQPTEIYIQNFNNTEPWVTLYSLKIKLAFLKGDFSEALSELKKGELAARELSFRRLRDQLLALKVDILLQSGSIHQAIRVAQENGLLNQPELTIELEDTNQMVFNLLARISEIRILLHQSAFQAALNKIKSLKPLLEKIGLVKWQICLDLLKFWAHEGLRQINETQQAFLEALKKAYLEGYITVFSELPQKLRQKFIEHLAKPNTNLKNLIPLSFRKKLLEHLNSSFKNDKKYLGADKKFKETFTKKEKQILDLMKTDWSNSKIAKYLCISEGTVKWHQNNIYRKLGVKKRLEAISKFNELFS